MAKPWDLVSDLSPPPPLPRGSPQNWGWADLWGVCGRSWWGWGWPWRGRQRGCPGRGIGARGEKMPSPLDELRAVVDAVNVPVQAVCGLSIEQAMETPRYGAPLVVLGAPFVITPDAFQTAGGDDLESKLHLICDRVHAYGNVGK